MIENYGTSKIKTPEGQNLEQTKETEDAEERLQAQKAKDAAIARALNAGEGFAKVMKIYNKPLEDFMEKLESDETR